MTWMDRLSLFSTLDLAALGLILATWLLIGWHIENPPRRRPSTSTLMGAYRREWMREMVTRQPRIFDAQTLSTLRESTSFFASATMIAIGGVLASIANADRLMGLANQITLESDPTFVWEIKMIAILFFLINAFLKFVWSNRLFGYCAVLMGAVPNDPKDPRALPRADKAATINITAARSFNRGLRSIYFALGVTAWLLGPVALMIATGITLFVLWRREFASKSRAALMVDDSPTAM
ncbi:DUF599 domain-containing protein [Pseudooceanicola nitratireducens]|jgi:uncharacterized membrane protein|nr:DUF599 domain-containing protein [Pseudooceanicola nitratireducens]MBY6157523.1 DUF599 domain-containing protein [Pseudooceanicola nitratireducens]MBY6164317.1 DUF599 domain-containing protein [Pseudooceanicola nitratireducens]